MHSAIGTVPSVFVNDVILHNKNAGRTVGNVCLRNFSNQIVS